LADRFCRNCGHELAEDDRFCPNCGTPVHEAAHVPTPEADVPVPPPPQPIKPAGDRQVHTEGDRSADNVLRVFVGAAAILVLLGLLYQNGGYAFLGVVAGFLAIVRWQFPRFLSRAEGGSDHRAGTTVLEKGSSEPLSEAERSRLLDDAVGRYLPRGFFARLRTPTTAQLVKPKRFSFLWAFLWFLLLGVGVVIYLIYYAAKKDDGVYLEVDEFGTVRATRQVHHVLP
jgi:hypothetical protein